MMNLRQLSHARFKKSTQVYNLHKKIFDSMDTERGFVNHQYDHIFRYFNTKKRKKLIEFMN